MSGASRELSSTEGSIFLAAAKAAALSRTAESALRPISKAGRVACDIENDMDRSWAVEPNASGLSPNLFACHNAVRQESAPSASFADMRDGVDLDFVGRVGKRNDLHGGGGGEIAAEIFLTRLRDALALVDVGDVNRDLDHVGHGAAGRLEELFDLAEDDGRLRVH